MKLVDDDLSMECSRISSRFSGVLTPERIKILRAISRDPAYPAKIARFVGMPLQTIYYHIKALEKAGLIEFVDYEEHNGGIAKRYRSRSKSLAIVLDKGGWKKTELTNRMPPKILDSFISHGFFNGRMIVGSPDPHGKYRARASEFGMLELSMYLGRYATFDFPLYSLDTRINDEVKKMNLIVAGGPKVNTFIAEINDRLPIRFDRDSFALIDRKSGRKYEENVGVVELIRNPFNRNSKILVVAGLNQHGTRAAIMALAKEKIEQNAVIQGFDEDGDGVVDSIEIL